MLVCSELIRSKYRDLCVGDQIFLYNLYHFDRHLCLVQDQIFKKATGIGIQCHSGDAARLKMILKELSSNSNMLHNMRECFVEFHKTKFNLIMGEEIFLNCVKEAVRIS